ncbi:MAG TPA: STAS/SEC14 domain-containing protein [Methylocystis sp.]|jgi:hypothetical protein
MIEIMPGSEGNVLGLKATGKLTHADYQETIKPQLESRLAEHGPLKLVFLMDSSFSGWDWRAALDDASLAFRHRADFRKLAVIGGPAWAAGAAKLASALMKGDIRIFPQEKLDEAWEWARA